MNEVTRIESKIQKTKQTANQLNEQLKTLIQLRNNEQNSKENHNVPRDDQKHKMNLVAKKASIEDKQLLKEHECSPKKVRNYNVDEARQYIKKQREKRVQKNELNEAKLKGELKRKKLQELHEKAQELVLRNVQIRQQRAKSRYKEQYVRIDASNQLKKQSSSGEMHCNVNETKKTHSSKQLKHFNKFTVSNVVCSQPTQISFPNEPSNLVNLNELKIAENSSNNVQLLTFTNIDEDKKLKVSGTMHNASKLKLLSNTPLESSSRSEKTEILESSVTRNKFFNKIKEKETNHEHVNISKVLPLIETKIKYPTWLQETPEMGHPLNFINTVKRKLQCMVSPHKTNIDVGIQNSLMEHNAFVTVGYPIKQKNDNVSNKRNFVGELFDTQSLDSHKYDNLDIKSVDHLELIPKSKQNNIYSSEYHANGLTENVKINHFIEGSESDTSKNIPDISSESGTSLKKNAESVKRSGNAELHLSIDKRKDISINLVPQTKSPTMMIESQFPGTHIKNDKTLLTTKNNKDETHLSNNSYDYDFESDNMSTPCFSKSRDSILSFNSPEYDQQVIIPSISEDHQVTFHQNCKCESSLKSVSKIPSCSPLKLKSTLTTEVLPLEEPVGFLNNYNSNNYNQEKNKLCENILLKTRNTEHKNVSIIDCFLNIKQNF